MRTTALVLTLALVVALAVAFVPAPAGADSHVPSISRDARGPQPTGEDALLGGPPTPQLYLLSQPAIFAFGVIMLVVAAVLGAYSFVSLRRTTAPR